MVSVLGGFVFVTALIYTASIMISFMYREDFFGIGIGIFVASAISFISKNLLWGFVQSLV